MKNKLIIDAWNNISPDEATLNRMLHGILNQSNDRSYVNTNKIKNIILAAIVSLFLLTTVACTAAVLTKWNPAFEKWFSPTSKVKEMIDSSIDTPNYTTTQHGWTLTVKQTIGDEYGFYCVIDIQLPDDFDMDTLKVDMDALMETAEEEGMTEDEVMEMLNAHGQHYSPFNYYHDVENDVWYAVPQFLYFHCALVETTAEDFSDMPLKSADEFGIFDNSSSYSSYRRLRDIYEEKGLDDEYYESNCFYKSLDFDPNTKTVTCMFYAGWKCEITGMPVTLVLTDPFYFDSIKHLITNDEIGENKRLLASEPFHLCWTPDYTAVSSQHYELFENGEPAGKLTLTPISAVMDLYDTTEYKRKFVQMEQDLAPVIALKGKESLTLSFRSATEKGLGNSIFLMSPEIIDLDRIKSITIGDYEVRKVE